MIKAEGLLCGYAAAKPVIGPLSFEVRKGEAACLIGPNGVGKTTLVKTVLGLLKPLGGRVLIDGGDLRGYAAKALARAVAYVPQSHAAPFPYTVREVAVMGCNPGMGELAVPGRAEYGRADEKLCLMGIDHLAKRSYTALSGGEQRLVLIARALAQNAGLLVMDEPTAHLDYGNEARVLEQVQRLAGMGYTVLMVTHMPNHAFMCAHRVLAAGKGGYFAQGPPGEVLTEETLRALYGIDIHIAEIHPPHAARTVRVCVPEAAGTSRRTT